MTKEKNIKNKPLIISDGCCIQYGDSSALDDVTFSISEGKKVAVVGPNGGGKSTLFNAIAGLLPLAHGSLKIKGMDPHEAKGLVSYVPQKDLINWNFSLAVKDVVEMGLTNKNSFNLFSRKKINATIKDSLNNVGLLHKINENINNLSGGQLQRVLIARALAQNADILLLDEAFSAVDVGAQEDIMQLINSINLDGKTIAIEGFGEHGPAMIDLIEERGGKVISISTLSGSISEPSSFDTADIRGRWGESGVDFVKSADGEVEPAWKVFQSGADILFTGSKMGAVNHLTAEKLKVAALVPHQPIPFTARALAILQRNNTIVVPDFIAVAAPIFASWPDTADPSSATTPQGSWPAIMGSSANLKPEEVSPGLKGAR